MADSDPVALVTDGTGPLTVDGTVTANQGTAAALAGAWSVEITDGTNVLGTSAHPVRTDPTGTTTQPVSGTVTANIGTSGSLALDATLTGGTQKTKIVDSAGTNLATVSAGGALKVDGSAVTQPVSGTVTSNQGTAAALSGGWPVKITDGTNVLGTSSNPVIVDPARPSTGTHSTVAASTSAVTILAANSARKGATIYNRSNRDLAIILATTTPTSSVFDTLVQNNGYYELPFGYTGIVKGIWINGSSPSNDAQVNELT